MAAPPCKAQQTLCHRVCAILPDEIMEEIFVRLPPKTVGRCRCLSRTWAAALSHDAFVDRHRRLASGRGGLKLFFLHDAKAGNMEVRSWSLADRSFAASPVAVFPDGMRTRCSSRCHGLVIMENTATGIHYVCNPSTGEMTALPRHGLNDKSLGIGYDARSKKHKVVRISYSYHRDLDGTEFRFRTVCEVYEINSKGAWRPPASSFALGMVRLDTTSVFAQGRLYWRRLGRQNPKIISFSLSDEALEALLPRPSCHGIDQLYGLAELGGHLCLFGTATEPVQQHSIWLLRDHEPGVWDLHCRIDLNAAWPLEVTQFSIGRGSPSPLAFIDDDRRLLFRVYCKLSKEERSKSAYKLYAYNPATGNAESLGFLPHRSTPPELYEESVVSTGRPFEDIVSSSASQEA
ncbi:hypothetical protein ACQJBY_055326 [Aegilops geniculata]